MSRVGSRVGSRSGTPVGGREKDRRERDKEREREVTRERERDREPSSVRVKGSSSSATAGSSVGRMKDPEREGEKERDPQIHPQFREREREQHLRDQHQQHNREQREHQPRDEEQPLNGPPSVRSWWTSGPSPPGAAAPPVPTAPRVPPGQGEGYPSGPYDRTEAFPPGPGAPYPIGMEYNGHPGEVYFETGMRPEVGVVPGEWGVWEEEEEEEDYDEVGEKRRARMRVHLGTFVYPRLPFPYFFDIDVGGGGAEKGMEENGDVAGERTEEKGMDHEGRVEEKGGQANPEKEKETGMDVDATPNPTLTVSASTEGGHLSTDVQSEKMVEDGEIADDEEKVKQKKEQEQAEASIQEQKILANPPENVPSSHGQPRTMSTFKVDTETRVTIVIPNGHIPLDKPRRPRIWGGGVFPRMRMPRRMIMPDGLHHIGSAQPEGTKEASGMADSGEREQPPLQPQRKEKRRRPKYRRVYTDDSDAFLCALHSGWVTWSGAAQARMEGKEMKIEVRVLRCIGAEGVGVGRFYGREEVVGRFLGGWGEKCFVPRGGLGEGVDASLPGERRGDEDVEMQIPEGELDDEENDGRGLVSAGWGTGHDGSAIEIVDARFVEVSVNRRVLSHLARFNEAFFFLRHV